MADLAATPGPAGVCAAEQEAHRLLASTFEQRLQEEVDKLGLDAADRDAVEDARKDLGPSIMRRIRYEALAPLTRARLQTLEQAPERQAVEEAAAREDARTPPG
ncbi:hypothetical protein [Bordetella genomosp. 9]|uniref:hypothetical protein n=1 Tax=Bordetella genomosp. 9 TaxID=1416803 RepID=UPI001E424F11|nr:hypothetical protein [Bordetella genomosp. 9]